jgi:hypothetical protein
MLQLYHLLVQIIDKKENSLHRNQNYLKGLYMMRLVSYLLVQFQLNLKL